MVATLNRCAVVFCVLFFAVLVPVTVAGVFPPPPGMDSLKALCLWFWLSCIGGIAGYGLYKI